jgi:hypothetical protein
MAGTAGAAGVAGATAVWAKAETTPRKENPIAAIATGTFLKKSKKLQIFMLYPFFLEILLEE